jgi:hypothetical protein
MTRQQWKGLTHILLDSLIGIALLGLAVGAAAAWITSPPAAPTGAVPSPTAVVTPDSSVEQALCDYARLEGGDLRVIGDVARDPRVRYALAMAASTYALDGSAGAREQLLLSCGRAGYR